MSWEPLAWVSALALLVGCGDDGDPPTGETFGVGSTSAGSTTAASSTTDLQGSSSTSGAEASTSSTGVDTDAQTTTTGGPATTGTTGGGEQTCERITEEQACMDAGCSWIGPSGQGDCVPPGDLCSGVMDDMQCNFISGCYWDEATMTCVPAGG